MTSNPVTQLRAPRYLAPHTGSNSHHPCVGQCSAQSAGPPKNKYMDLLPAGVAQHGCCRAEIGTNTTLCLCGIPLKVINLRVKTLPCFYTAGATIDCFRAKAGGTYLTLVALGCSGDCLPHPLPASFCQQIENLLQPVGRDHKNEPSR